MRILNADWILFVGNFFLFRFVHFVHNQVGKKVKSICGEDDCLGLFYFDGLNEKMKRKTALFLPSLFLRLV